MTHIIALLAAALLLPHHAQIDGAMVALIQITAMRALDEQMNNLCGWF